MLSAGRTAPRTVVGSVSASEFLVALAASAGFLVGLGHEVLDPSTIGGLLIGGVLAAPLAAWLVTRIPAPVLGSAVGGVIILTNARTLLRAADASGAVTAAVYAVILVLWALAIGAAVTRLRRSRTEDAATPVDQEQPVSTG
nr:hypothetical protein [Pseudonocardia sp. ICBG601]